MATRVVSTIEAGETAGSPVRAGRITRIGVPADMSGSQLQFVGAVEMRYFAVRTLDGSPLTIPTRVAAANPATAEVETSEVALSALNMVPVRPESFAGLMVVRPVSNRPEAEKRFVEFYME